MPKKKSFSVFPCIFFLAYIGFFCYLGLYACPWKDDYWVAAKVREVGVIKNVANMYMGIFGGGTRPVSFLLWSLGETLPIEQCYWIFPLITAATYILAVYFVIRTVYPDISFSEKILSVLGLTAATFAVLYSLDQTFYALVASHYFWSSTFMLIAFAFSVKLLAGGGD